MQIMPLATEPAAILAALNALPDDELRPLLDKLTPAERRAVDTMLAAEADRREAVARLTAAADELGDDLIDRLRAR
jgi:hypothetical protein